MEFITDITVKIDGADFNDHGGLMKILQSYRHENKGSCFTVRGTFEELERLRVKLQREQTSTRVRPVHVSVAVMDYIQQKCANELSKIQGNSFVIETQPSIGTEHNSSSTMQVTLRPLHASTSPVHADLVRQRFITFYQRAASDLQITSVPVSPHCKDLEKKFSHLLFKPSHNKNELTVSGLFVHVAKLKEFLLQNTPSSSKSPENIGPADSLSSKTLGGSPTHSKDHENESCPICMEVIVMTEKETLRCKHSFCKGCLKQAFAYKPVCPTCGVLYGTLTGTQPEGGRMNVITTRSPLPGYEKYGTIIIEYYIPSGIQKEEHPNPGQPYEGVFRTAYLPDSSEGRRIFKLLQRAFDQKLIFTVGRSTTSGRNNTVTWNDIHHKTSTHGGPTHYGYPDPDYLRRIRDELKVKGIE